MAQKITRYLLIILLLSLGFGQLLRFNLYNSTIYLHDCLVLFIIVLNFSHLIKPQTWSYPGLKLILAGLGIGWLVALLTMPASSLVLPFLYLIRLISYLSLFLILTQTKFRLPYEYFIFAGLTTLTIGLLQFWLLPDMRVFQYLGWDDHLNRLTLPHFDPTYTGAMLVLFLFALNIKQQLLIWGIALGIFLTYSRSILLSFAAAQIVVLRNFFYLFLAMIFVIYVTFIRPHGFGEGTNLLRTYSITSRVGRDLAVASSSGWKILTGSGYNTYATATLSEKGYPNHAVGPNSSYLCILSTTGVIGLLGWIIWLKKLAETKTMRASIIFVAIASLFNNVLLYPFVLLWIILLNFRVPNEA